MAAETVTPYSTVAPLIDTGLYSWVPELEQERLASYDTYENMYWNVPDTFKLMQRGDAKPILIPKPMTVVDTTSHYFMKNLQVTLPDHELDSELHLELKKFLAREKFYSKFHVSKHSGVVRGDFILHLTADPLMPEGARISLNSVDPRSYFPVYNDDDLTKLEAVHLVEQFYSPDKDKTFLKKLTYRYELVGGRRQVSRSEGIFELEDWFDPEKEKMVTQTLTPELLPLAITTIPVYHFRNKDWQGDFYGSSELRGFERIIAGINQSISDEELTLALDGLGVYHTDAPKPRDANGNEVDWVVGPAKVLETAGGTFFKRVEGVGSVKPVQDHVGFLEGTLHEASGTSDVAIGKIDTNTAESGIALAIKFMPTLAKIEERDMAGTELLANLFFDWQTMWMPAYEGQIFDEIEIIPVLGEKLPENRAKKIEELNNMMDRKVISRAYYRQEMQKFGYEFPDNIEQQILDEEEALKMAMAAVSADGEQDPNDPRNTLEPRNRSNNAQRTNESNGTEIDAET